MINFMELSYELGLICSVSKTECRDDLVFLWYSAERDVNAFTNAV